jgi:HD-like signal output (HDOD) protein/signal transduction histidine kinase
MPQLLLRLLELCQDEDAGTSDYARLISQDPALTSKVISVANSAAYMRPGTAANLEQAVQRIGTEVTRTLVVSQSVFQVFNDFSHAGSADLGHFWHHALHAAISARLIARKTGYPNLEEAYLGGLLHDVGRLALHAIAPAEYNQLIHCSDTPALCLAEEAALQITHAEAGAWLIERWKLNSFLADSALYHHEEVDALDSAHPLVRIVLLAHLLSQAETHEMAIEVASQCCGLSPEELLAVQSETAPLVSQMATDLGIQLPETPSAGDTQQGNAVEARQALADGLQQHILNREGQHTLTRQREESALFAGILAATNSVFDVDLSCILLADTISQALRGMPQADQPARLAEITIPFGSQNSPLAAAMLSRQTRIISPLQTRPGISEQQLIRLLGCEALIALPMTGRSQSIGLLVIGTSEVRIAAFRRQLPFLQAFAHQATVAALDLRAEQEKAIQATGEIQQQQQLAARKLAHEINNPLAIISNYLSVLEARLARGELPGNAITTIREEIARVGQLAHSLSKPPVTAAVEAWSLNSLLENTLALFRDSETLHHNIDFVTDLDNDMPQLTSDSAMFRQVLVNLIKNAIEAMPDGGEIRIDSLGAVNRDGGLFYELQISDNGPGIPTEVLKGIFAPVETSKGDHHQGLGLAIVKDLMTRLRGHISCRSNRRGTAFNLLLPLPDGETVAR